MKFTVRKETFVDRERSVTIRFADNALPTTYCRQCAPQSRFVTIDEATTMLHNNSSRQIFRLVENNRIHYTETPEGLLLVCLVSLAAANANQLTNGEK